MGKKDILQKFVAQNYLKKLKVHLTQSANRFQIRICSISASCPASLIPASLPILIKDKPLTALVDSGSSESYINSTICSKLGQDVYPTTHQVQMASTAMTIKSTSFSLVDISINKTCYPSTRLNILEILCSDVILGLDFQSKHQNLVIKFDGESPDLVVAPQSRCFLMAAKTPEVSLFSNLSKNVTPIATRLRCYNPEDRAFIQENVNKLLEEEIIRPSSSPGGSRY